MAQQHRYRAFISYSRADKRGARRLQKGLERYRIPRGVETNAGPKRRVGRFFRDDDEMAATPDIHATVREAIEDAESLIVVCSPHAARSAWVNAEILHFRETGRADRIFAVITDGRPNSEDPQTECYPPALRTPRAEDSPALRLAEPLGLDLRKESFSRTRTRLVAGLLGIEFDALWQREKRRRRLVAAVVTGLGALALALIATVSLQFLAERQERQRAAALQRKNTLESLSRIGDRSALLADLSAKQEDPAVGALLALDAWNVHDPRPSPIPLRALAARAPEERLRSIEASWVDQGYRDPAHPHATAEVRRNMALLREKAYLKLQKGNFQVAFSPGSNNVLLGYETGEYFIVDRKDGRRLAEGRHADYIQTGFYNPAGSVAYTVSAKKIEAVSLPAGKLVFSRTFPERSIEYALQSPKGDKAAVFFRAGAPLILNLLNGADDGPLALSGSIPSAAWTSSGWIMMALRNTLYIQNGYDLAHGRAKVDLRDEIRSMKVFPKGSDLLIAEKGGRIEIFSQTPGGAPPIRFQEKEALESFELRRDFNRLYIGLRTANVAVWDLGKLSKVASLDCDGNPFESITTSPSHQFIAAGTRKGTICVWRTEDHALVWRNEVLRSAVTWLGFSTSDTELWSASADGSLRTWSLPEPRPAILAEGCESDLLSLIFDPSGRHLYGRAGVMGICRWDVPEITSRRDLPGYRLSSEFVPFSPGGESVIVTDRAGRIERLNAVDLDAPVVFQGSDAIFHDAGYPLGRDGGMVGHAVDGSLWIWRPSAPMVPVRLQRTFPGNVKVFAIAADGRMVCVLDPATGGYVFSGITGKVLMSLDLAEKLSAIDLRLHESRVMIGLADGRAYAFPYSYVLSGPGRVTSLAAAERFEIPPREVGMAQMIADSPYKIGIGDVASDRLLYTIEKPEPLTQMTYGAVLAPSGRYVAAILWQWATPRTRGIAIWPVPEIVGRKSNPRAAADLGFFLETSPRDAFLMRQFWVAEAEQWVFATAAKHIHRCLSPIERARFNLGPDPPCWCAGKTYPTVADWKRSLGYDPFRKRRSDGFACSATDFAPWLSTEGSDGG